MSGAQREGIDRGARTVGPRLPGADRTLAAQWADVVAAVPDADAIRAGGRRSTYRDTDRRAGSLAARFDDAGDDPAAPLGLLVGDTVHGVTAIVAGWLCSRPIVLCDPQLPPARIADILRRAGADTCFVEQGFGDPSSLCPAGPDLAYLPLPAPDDLDRAIDGPCSPPSATRAGRPDDVPAAIVYTSGSTGAPKGVAVGDRSLLNEALGGIDAFSVCPGDRVALTLPSSFLAGLSVVAIALLGGATVCVRDPRRHGLRDLATWLRAEEVTTLHLTPSQLRAIVAALAPGERLDRLRLVTTCGEPVYDTDVAALAPHLDTSRAAFVNWSGSSETGHIGFHHQRFDLPGSNAQLPAGRVAGNKEVRVVHSTTGAPVAQGETGEIEVISRFLPSGYWRAPEMTAARYRPLEDGRVAVRTGDLGSVDADGVVRLRGRTDSAVKVRGYLVEPSEIEVALLRLPGVSQAVVEARTDHANAIELVAFVVTEAGQDTLSVADLRRRLRDALPVWMVPRSIQLLASFPTNERGKVDRRRLPTPRLAASTPVNAPARSSTPREAQVAELWARQLGVEAIDASDDFYDLGGDSLDVVEMLTRVEERWGRVVTSGAFVQATTVAEFAALLDATPAPSPAAAALGSGLPEDPGGVLVPLRTDGDATPIFCFAGGGAAGMSFAHLARRIPAGHPVYAFQAKGLERRSTADWSVRRAARRQANMIRALQPEGPYHLVGHSLGGLHALEVARILRAEGAEIGGLTVVDTYLRGVPRPIPPMPSSLATPGAEPERATRGQARSRAHRAGGWRGRLRHALFVLLSPLAGWVPFGRHNFDLFFAQGRLLLQSTRVRPWDGPICLLVDRHHPQRERWQRLLDGPEEQVEILVRSFEHSAVLREPLVGEVADLASRALAARRLQAAGDREAG